MQKLNINFKKIKEMIEFQNSIQDWVPATRYRVSHRSLVDRGLFPLFGEAWGMNIFDPPPPLTETQILQTAINICVFHLYNNIAK